MGFSGNNTQGGGTRFLTALERKEQGCTVLMVTHDPRIMDIADPTPPKMGFSSIDDFMQGSETERGANPVPGGLFASTRTHRS